MTEIQDVCLINELGAGSRYMSQMDMLPQKIRILLKENEFNLCVACVEEYAQDLMYEEEFQEIDAYRQAIEIMNSKIRKLDVFK